MTDEIPIELVALPAEEDEPGFEHRPSRIAFRLIEGDSRMLPGLEVDDIWCDGGDAQIEAEGISLDDVVAVLLDEGHVSRGVVDGPGSYIVLSFSVHYSKSYEGEYDADYSAEGFRKMTDQEVEEVFGTSS